MKYHHLGIPTTEKLKDEIHLEHLKTELATAYTHFSQVTAHLHPDKHNQAGVSGAWSPKDVIAHLIGWDKALQAFIADPDRFDPTPLYDIDTFNAKSVLERRQQSWAETVAELQSSYQGLQKALDGVTVEMKMYKRVGEWLKGRRQDYEFHTAQMTAWIG